MAKATKAQRSAAVVGEVCLYGAPTCGHGWLARTVKGTMLGDGEPLASRSLTDALWLALDALQGAVTAETGKPWGRVEVYEPSGRSMSEVAVTDRPYFGSLVWQRAGVVVVSAEAVRAAAEEGKV